MTEQDKSYVVVELDYMNDCGVGRFADAIGPFTHDGAFEHADALNAKKHYGTEYRVERLCAKHWSES